MNETPETVYSAGNLSDRESPGWMDVGVHVYIKILAIAVLFWYFFSIDINGIVHKWIKDPSWSHGFLIPFFSLYFINQQKENILRLKTRPDYFGLAMLIMCLFIFYPLNIVQFRVAYVQSLIMIATLGSIVLFMGGWKLVRYTWLAVLYLVFAVPLPDSIYQPATIPMRIFSAWIATVFLNLVPGLETTASGAVIDVVYNGIKMEPPLDVAEACSGMRLLMTFFALGVAMAYLHYRPLWQRLVLLAGTIPIAIICNIVRVTVTGFIYILWDPQYAQGLWHDLLGMSMLILAFALYGVLAWFMSNLFVEEPGGEQLIIRRLNSEKETTGST